MKRGDLIEFNGRVAAVIGLPGDAGVPEDHVALWFGGDAATPVVYTVPAEYCRPAPAAEVRHSWSCG